MTDRELSKDGVFVRACKLADTKPTVRQASKWRKGLGKAYTKRDEARYDLSKSCLMNDAV